MQTNVGCYVYGSKRVEFGNNRYPRIGPCRRSRTERGVLGQLSTVSFPEIELLAPWSYTEKRY